MLEIGLLDRAHWATLYVVGFTLDGSDRCNQER
jgi:hypothetical protein